MDISKLSYNIYKFFMIKKIKFLLNYDTMEPEAYQYNKIGYRLYRFLCGEYFSNKFVYNDPLGTEESPRYLEFNELYIKCTESKDHNTSVIFNIFSRVESTKCLTINQSVMRIDNDAIYSDIAYDNDTERSIILDRIVEKTGDNLTGREKKFLFDELANK